MVRFKKILFLIIFLFTTSIAIAQTNPNVSGEDYRLVHWTMNEGLSSDDKQVMLKDVTGFLWIGSANGLNRFDGFNFKHYFPDKNTSGAICDANISNLVEDSMHNIWIGTSNGMSRHDNETDTFKNFSPAPNAVHKYIMPFCATKDKVYCVEGGFTLTVFDVHSFEKKVLWKISPEYSGGDYDMAHSFFESESNSLWMPERFIPGKSVGGLCQISLSNGKKNHYTWQCYKNIPNHLHDIKDICYDEKRNIIWVSSTDGLLQFTLGDKQFHRVEALNGVQDLKDTNAFFPGGVTLDKKGNVWWCSWPVGPVVFNPSTQTFRLVFSDMYKQRQVAHNNLFIYCDRDGISWTGCSEQERGICQISPASVPVVRYGYAADTARFSLRGNFDLQVVNSGSGKLWVSQGDDIYAFDPQTGYFHQLSLGNYLPIFKNHLINFMQIDSVHQKALFDIWNRQREEDALYEMDIPTMKCYPVIFKDRLNQTIDPPKQFNVCSYKNEALIFSNISNGTGMLTVNIDSAIARWTDLSFTNFAGFSTDNDHLIFINNVSGENNLTYSCLNGEWTKVGFPLDSLKWSAIFYDKKDKTYWIGLGSELVHYTNNFQVTHSYTAEEISPGDAIVGILPDEKGNMWLRFNRSVSWLNLATGKITALSEKDGFIKRPLDSSLIMDRSLYIWGMNGGLDRVNLDKLKEKYPPSFAYIKSLMINEKPFSTATVNDLKELSLNYNQNKLAIETGAIDYYAKGDNRIRYKLESLNKNWQIAPANYIIRYEQLPPGNYKLIIQASNAANEFNGPEKILFINISPAFWNTWWFRLLIIAIASYIIVSIFRARIKKIQHDAFIQNQLKELEMKALKAQMNPHFIYNALNSIQALVANDKKTEGIHYIGSFSRLLRQVLDNSENNTISLDKELETIGLYIQLETLRLDMQLQYRKIVPADIVAEFEKIPPLILQPFVENALWHGLGRKEGEKEIEIAVSAKDDWLLCDIKDNGIGREKAQEWKNNSTVLYRSKGIEITRKRLTDFNDDDLVAPIEFYDLYDFDGNACGTHVTVRIKRKSSMALA